MAPDWARVRREFPALDEWTYLNTATYGQTPLRAYAAVERHFARRNAKACGDFLEWFDDADVIRRDVGRLVGCAGEDIAFLATAAQALSLVIGGIDWQAGERVVTLEHEFPNNLYYPALLEQAGVQFVETSWERLYDELKPGTRLVAISTVNYTNGFRPPVEELARECDRRGILLYVDGTQSVGALSMDIGRLRPAMMAVDAYKWMLTPNGAGFAYVDPRVRQWLKPNVVGWRSHWDWRNVDRLHHGAPEFSDKAERYEGGMLPFPALYAMGEVTRMMLELGSAEIEARVQELAGKLRGVLLGLGAQLGGTPATGFDSPVIAARWEGRDASALARTLRERRVLVSARHGNLRVSVHFYNNEDDLARLERELRSLGFSG